MRTASILKNSGMTIVETMISITIITGTMFFCSMAYLEVKKSRMLSDLMVQKNELAADMISELSLYTQCNSLIRKAMGTGNIEPNFSGEISVAPFVDLFAHPRLELKSVVLQYNPTVEPDPDTDSKYASYNGILSFYFDSKGESNDKIKLKPASARIWIFDEHGSGKWSGAVCSTQMSGVSSNVGETCALYGGTLTDGTHCDFSRYFRQHQDLPESAVQVKAVNDGKRFTLSDVLCYLDTLATIIPDQDMKLPGKRDYKKDMYSKNYVTRYCKKPGHVAESPIVDMGEIAVNINEDIRPALLDLGSFAKTGSCKFMSYNPYPGSYSCVATCNSAPVGSYQGKPVCYDTYYASLEYQAYMNYYCQYYPEYCYYYNNY